MGGDDSVVFPDSIADMTKTPSPQPKNSINHAEGKTKEVKPRFGFDTSGPSTNFDFGVQPNAGGISGSASFSSSYSGQAPNQDLAGSQSQSFNFQTGSSGFSASHSASQASSFNSQLPGCYGYESGNCSTESDL